MRSTSSANTAKPKIDPSCCANVKLKLCTKLKCLTVSRNVGVHVKTAQYTYCTKKMKPNAFASPPKLPRRNRSPICPRSPPDCTRDCHTGDSGVRRASGYSSTIGNTPRPYTQRQPP